MEKEFVEPAANAALKKKATHTPGPWHIHARWAKPGTTECGHEIAHGINSYGDGPEGIVCRTGGTSEADARLIAAAPDLLAAADALWGAAVPHSRVVSGEVVYYEVERAKMNALRAAILKATSGSRTEGPAPTPLSE